MTSTAPRNFDSKMKKFNNALVKSGKDITVRQYVRVIAERVYKMDVGFMEENIEYIIKRGEFCVPHTKLIETGVVTINDSMKIRRLLTVTRKFKEGVDYICKVAEEGKKKGSPQKTYTLTPKAYRMCLMRSRNSDKYADYYCLLEDAIHYYSEYQVTRHKGEIEDWASKCEENKKLADRYKAQRDDAMKQFYESVAANKEDMKKAAEQRDEDRKKAAEQRDEDRKKAAEEMKKAAEQRDEDRKKAAEQMKEDRKKAAEQMKEDRDKALEAMRALSQQRVPDPPKDNQKEQIKIMKLVQLVEGAPMYYIMRRQKKGMASAILELANKRPIDRVVLTIDTPNAKNMFLRAKKLLGEQMTVKCNLVKPKKNKTPLTPLEIKNIFSSIKTKDTTVTLEA